MIDSEENSDASSLSALSPGLAGQSSHAVAEQMRAFTNDSLAAFAQGGIRLAAHAIGAGHVYELCHLAKKGLDAIDAATSDHGAELSLPEPLAGVDLMVRVRIGGSQDEHQPQPPFTVFVAPGDNSVAAAIELTPVTRHDEEHQSAEGTGLRGHARVGRKRRPAPGGRRAAEDEQEAPGIGQPVDDKHVRMYGRVAVMTVDLEDLRDYESADRLGILQSFAVHKLRPFALARLRPFTGDEFSSFAGPKPRPLFTGNHPARDLTLVICYDPARGIVFWVRLDQEPLPVWSAVAEFDAFTGCLVIKELGLSAPP